MPELNAYLILHTLLWLSCVTFLFGAGLLLSSGIAFRDDSARG